MTYSSDLEEWFYKNLIFIVPFCIFTFFTICGIAGIISDNIALKKKRKEELEKTRQEKQRLAEITSSPEFKRLENNITTSYDNYVKLIKTLSNSDTIANFTVRVTNNNQRTYEEYKTNSISNSEFVYECSAQIVQSVKKNPFPYLCKYFNIEYSEKTLETLQKILQLTTYRRKLLKENYNINYFADLLKTARYTASYMFYYESPQGNSNSSCAIDLTPGNIKGLIAHIQGEIENKQSKAQQRSLMTPKLRNSIKQRDNYTCCNCGNSILNEPNLLLEVDHITPIAKGGKTEYYNLQTLCWRCNRRKSDKVY